MDLFWQTSRLWRWPWSQKQLFLRKHGCWNSRGPEKQSFAGSRCGVYTDTHPELVQFDVHPLDLCLPAYRPMESWVIGRQRQGNHKSTGCILRGSRNRFFWRYPAGFWFRNRCQKSIYPLPPMVGTQPIKNWLKLPQTIQVLLWMAIGFWNLAEANGIENPELNTRRTQDTLPCSKAGARQPSISEQLAKTRGTLALQGIPEVVPGCMPQIGRCVGIASMAMCSLVLFGTKWLKAPLMPLTANNLGSTQYRFSESCNINPFLPQVVVAIAVRRTRQIAVATHHYDDLPMGPNDSAKNKFHSLTSEEPGYGPG